MARAKARLKPLFGREDRRQDGKFQAACGKCGKFLSLVDVHDHGSAVAFRVGWAQHNTGVWWLTDSSESDRAVDLRNLQEGTLTESEQKKARSRLRLNSYRREVRVRTPQTHIQNAESSFTSLPLEMKCPRCPTINLVALDKWQELDSAKRCE